MPNTYSQLYVQIIFAVKGGINVIREINRDEIERYICGIIRNKKSKPIAIYCNPDHLHVLVGIHPSVSVSDLTRDIKANSSKFVNEKKWFSGRFSWQDGFGSFSYSRSQIDSVSKYILGQPTHHKRRTFKEEYLEILRKSEMEYDEQYLFEWYE
jgi:REP element-mobilizing transposase RayT